MTDKPTSPPTNRRRCRRQTPRGGTRATCIKGAMGLGKNIALAVLDLSEEGIRLRVAEMLQAGQEVEVQLESVNRARPFKVLGTVAWAVPAADGSCCIGVRFQRTIPYIDMVSFIRV